LKPINEASFSLYYKLALLPVPVFYSTDYCDLRTGIYSVSQKKTSPTFLAITRESIVGFS